MEQDKDRTRLFHSKDTNRLSQCLYIIGDGVSWNSRDEDRSVQVFRGTFQGYLIGDGPSISYWQALSLIRLFTANPLVCNLILSA